MRAAPPEPPRASEAGTDRFHRRDGPQPHIQRARALLRAHPDLQDLVGPQRWTMAITVATVAAQLALAWSARLVPWWLIPIGAYVVGAALSHLGWTIIHEATHKLLARPKWVNDAFGILSNVPLLVPGYASFRKYHHLHHRYLGDYRADADLASVKEAKWTGRSPLRKALWLLGFPFVQMLRTKRLARFPFWDRLVVVNIATLVVTDVLLALWLGVPGMAYLALSLVFSIGLHPLGARWIQEHYVFRPGQETYSCYSPANAVQLNIGYHVEHHDMPFVPWSRLPAIRRRAPEFYDSLYSHPSWTRLLLRFVFSPSLTLFSRIVRDEPNSKGARKQAALEVEPVTD